MKNKGLRPITPMHICPRTINGLVKAMGKTGFQGRALAEIIDVMEEMLRDPHATILMGYAGSLSTAGMWPIIVWLMKNHYIDILVPTGANISEDIQNAMGFPYYQIPSSNQTNDTEFFTEGLNRYYDHVGKEIDYLAMTEIIAEFMETLDRTYAYSSIEFLHLFGYFLARKSIFSIVTEASHDNIPIFCAAIADSPYGDASLIARSNNVPIILDAFKDYYLFMSLNIKVKDTGVIYIGGGVPKDIVQLFSVTGDLLYKDRKIPNRDNAKMRNGTNETYHPHKYAIQMTLALTQDGGLSGCTFEEATSWGKETPEGKFKQCYVDATIGLPILAHAILERDIPERKGNDFSLLFQDNPKIKEWLIE